MRLSNLNKGNALDKLTPLELKLQPKGQDFISVYPFCCLHIGHINSDTDKIKELLAQIVKDKNSYIILNGDLTENTIPSSASRQRGAMYDQCMNPKEQVSEVVKLLSPVKSRILGVLEGNHSLRSWYETNFSVEEQIANKLGVPYLGIDGLFHLMIYSSTEKGYRTYKIHSTHGTGGASGPGGVINKVISQATRFQNCDIHVMGHFHQQVSTKKDTFDANGDKQTKTFVATGSFLSYLNSYAHHALMNPVTLGIPEIRFYSNRHDIKVVL